MYEQSPPRLSPLWLSAIIVSACHGLLKSLLRDKHTCLQSPARQKYQRTEAGRQQLPACHRCVSVMLLRSMQNTRRS